MRMIAAIAVSALALAACSKPSTQGAQSAQAGASTASGPDSGGGMFPDLFGAAYRLEATAIHDGKSQAVVMVRSGHKMRMEMQSDEGPVIAIIDPDAQQSIMIMNQGGRQ